MKGGVDYVAFDLGGQWHVVSQPGHRRWCRLSSSRRDARHRRGEARRPGRPV